MANVRVQLETGYVLVVAVVATTGFVTDSTAMILSTATLALPMSLPAFVGYYLAYGALALVPGANPSTASGSGSCSAGGNCKASTTGDLAPWFEHTTDVIGILALTLAAVANVLLVRLVTTKLRAGARHRTAEQK